MLHRSRGRSLRTSPGTQINSQVFPGHPGASPGGRLVAAPRCVSDRCIGARGSKP
jgi:hypothetical protein